MNHNRNKRTPTFVMLLLSFFGIFQSCSESNTQEQPNPNVITSDTSQWHSLFNGKNMEGWQVKSVKEDQDYHFWRVENGAIVINSLGIPKHDYSWLVTDNEYADFELKLKFQSYRESPGNSGVQIRSRYDDEGTVNGSEAIGWLDGPQIDIHPSGAWRTGFIYDETRGHQRWIYPDLPDWQMDSATYAPTVFQHYFADETPQWNDLLIICKGNHITTVVNQVIISDFDGSGVLDDESHQKYGIDQKGHIALQLHKGDELKIAFKDIYIKTLP